MAGRNTNPWKRVGQIAWTGVTLVPWVSACVAELPPAEEDPVTVGRRYQEGDAGWIPGDDAGMDAGPDGGLDDGGDTDTLFEGTDNEVSDGGETAGTDTGAPEGDAGGVSTDTDGPPRETEPETAARTDDSDEDGVGGSDTALPQDTDTTLAEDTDAEPGDPGWEVVQGGACHCRFAGQRSRSQRSILCDIAKDALGFP